MFHQRRHASEVDVEPRLLPLVGVEHLQKVERRAADRLG